MTSLNYIPPRGVYFRLYGYSSCKVICSRTHTEPQVFHHPFSEKYGDQFFTLIHGEGERKGLYAIKSQRTNKVLFSRRHQEPRVWHTDGDGKYKDNWFELESGTGVYSNYFRLVTPSQKATIYSSRPEDHSYDRNYFDNYPSDREIYPDQYFTFLWEDMECVGIEYDLDDARLLDTTPVVLADQKLENDSSLEQEMNFSVSEGQQHTSTFNYTLGFTITVGAQIEGGIPFVAEGTAKYEVSNSHQFSWGLSKTFTKTYTASFPVHCGPRKVVKAVSTVQKSTLDVPYTITLRSKSTGTEVTSKGRWQGVTTYGLRHSITERDMD